MASASPSNGFLEVVSKAKAWLKNQDSSLSLDKIEEGDKKIIITISSDSLYIVPPDCSTEQWVSYIHAPLGMSLLINDFVPL